MTIPRARARLLGVVFTATTLALMATAAYAQTAPTGGTGTIPPGTVATLEPTESPTPDPTPDPTPTEPDEACAADSAPTPTVVPTPTEAVSLALVSYQFRAETVTCEDTYSNITVTWDGKTLKVVIKPAPTLGGGKCALDPTSVKAPEPKNAKVNADGSVEIPYNKDKKEKITIKIEYDLVCGNETRKLILTIEFTPPDGPLSTKNKLRP